MSHNKTLSKLRFLVIVPRLLGIAYVEGDGF